MNRIVKNIVLGLMSGAMLVGCADWLTPERVITQHPENQSPIVRDDAYYAALRAYKQTKHRLAFGWYGSWTAVGPSYQSRLQSAPDSMDIISIWSQWHSLTPEQKADKEFVQKVKGTKVIYTIFLHDLPEEFQCEGWPDVSYDEQQECIENFARSYCRDSMDLYQYDGIDLDYEPGYGGQGALTGNPAPDLFNRTITAMSKYVGPKSGTGRLLVIDGVPYAVNKQEIIDMFDYGIVQAYNSTGYSDLQSRFNNAYNVGWKPEQYIFAENFESFWRNGGVDHTLREGGKVNSLLGMARFTPEQGFPGGFGAYHMEYEYAHNDMPYKYMRRAIQDVNPAGGYMTVSLTSTTLERNLIILEPDGSLTGDVKSTIALHFSRMLPEDVTFEVVCDNDFVDVYNMENGTSYKKVDPAAVEISELTGSEGAQVSDVANIGFAPEELASGEYIIPIVVKFPETGIYMSQKKDFELVKYIRVTVAPLFIDTEATSLEGTKIAPAPGWTITCYQEDKLEGANGVWNLDTDAQKAKMFDGKLDDGAWYASSADFSWGNGGNFVVELDKPYEISGFRWSIYYTDSNPEVLDVLYSEDGENWSSLLNGMKFVPEYEGDRWKIFKFKKAMTAKYIRVIVGKVTGYTSMNEIEFYTPAN